MNATRLLSLSAAVVAVTLVTAGCASNRDDRVTQTPAPMTPVAAAPMAEQPVTVVAVTPAPAPAPMAAAPADPVMTPTQPTFERAAPSARMSDDNLMERAPRADRN